MNSDFKELLQTVNEESVRYLVVGGYAVARAWSNRTMDDSEGFPIWYLGKADLITAKQAAGRPQDLADLDELRRADSP
ncbi:MAG: hypothetical protein O3A87_11215 [Verrucomicrobia bacterium]|nr:hypothetical protein [Verrucomicrobiota bacterium]MDA1007032.1 hypothetical protein [Verrucomicrobiota bacterium]